MSARAQISEVPDFVASLTELQRLTLKQVSFFCFVTLGLEMSDTKVYEP